MPEAWPSASLNLTACVPTSLASYSIQHPFLSDFWVYFLKKVNLLCTFRSWLPQYRKLCLSGYFPLSGSFHLNPFLTRVVFCSSFKKNANVLSALFLCSHHLWVSEPAAALQRSASRALAHTLPAVFHALVPWAPQCSLLTEQLLASHPPWTLKQSSAEKLLVTRFHL